MTNQKLQMSQTQQGTFRSKKLTGKMSPNQSLLSQLNTPFTVNEEQMQ